MNRMQMNYEVLADRLVQISEERGYFYLQTKDSLEIRIKWKKKQFPLFVTFGEGGIIFTSKSGAYRCYSDAFDAIQAFWTLIARIRRL